MAFIADVSRLGIIPFQEHQEDWGPSQFQNKNTVSTRGLPQGGRVVYDEQVGGPVIEPETRGPWVGGFLWESADTATHPHIWSVACPVNSLPPSATCVPAGGLSTGRELANKAGLQKWRPVFGPRWNDPQNDLTPVSLVSPAARVLPGDYPGICLDSVDTGFQHDLVLPAGHMLIAPHKGGRGTEGTPVYDVDKNRKVDYSTVAPLQSMFRVWRRQDSQNVCLGNGSLAWQMSTAAGNIPGGGFIAQGPPNKQRLGATSDELGGPFHTVGRDDQHSYSESADGEPIAPAHVSTQTIFFNPTGEGDAPLEFGGFYAPVPQAPLLTQAFLKHDPDSFHNWAMGAGIGLWRWQSSSYFAIIDKRRDPPPFPPPLDSLPPPGGGGFVGAGQAFSNAAPGSLANTFINSASAAKLNAVARGGSVSGDGQVRSAGTLPPAPPQVPRIGDSAPRNARLVGTPNEIAVPALTFRAQNFSFGAMDLRNVEGEAFASAGEEIICEFAMQPAVARLEAVAMQDSTGMTGFSKTTESSQSRFGEDIGTACGGVWIMRPEQGYESLNNEPPALSKTYFGVCGTKFAAGMPSTTSGAYTGGFDWGLNANADLSFGYRNDDGDETEDMAMITSRATIQTQAGYEISGYNGTGSAISDGKVVTMPSGGGVTGFMPNIDVVSATTDTPIGIVVGDIGDASAGTVLTRGAIDGITISGSPSVGDPVYFDASGDLTFTEPFTGATPIGLWWG